MQTLCPSCHAAVPPHTRGWSRAGAARRVRLCGSPAHAGMVPRPRCRRGGGYRFPRTRGDGPWRNPMQLDRPPVPPHTRGWSPDVLPPPVHDPGSPAHAGMVPVSRSCAAQRRWFPRTRGDGPRAGYGLRNHDLVPPHTRGWSLYLQSSPAPESGSPAHAGMVPNPATHRAAFLRFPRTRGDGPTPCTHTFFPRRVPPHTREWSHGRPAWRAQGDGSPAHGGMVPNDHRQFVAPSGFPRTRGDGPREGARIMTNRVVPPHTRGWSRRNRRDTRKITGSPAHAGMVRMPGVWSGCWAWFPRTRGDGPVIGPTGIGIEPVSPHTRGWSPVPGSAAAGQPGSPAHAGMVPYGPGGCNARTRFPRTRGDGPGLSLLHSRPSQVPPHTRGWSL